MKTDKYFVLNKFWWKGFILTHRLPNTPNKSHFRESFKKVEIGDMGVQGIFGE
jgi:hypothetical protein